MTIIEHQTLEMNNVMSYRGKMTQTEIAEKSKEIEQLMKAAGANKTAPVATTTFAVEQSARGLVMDIEILVPMDKSFTLPSGYVWKSKFLLTNAVMIHYVGNPAGLNSVANELNSYIASNKLVPITTGYSVTVKEAKTPSEIDAMEVEIYVGINPNIL